MNISFEEYKEQFLENIRIDAQIDGSLPDQYFLTYVLNRLASMGEIIDPIQKPIHKKCRKNKIMSFDAYAFDESDKSFVLIYNDFKDSTNETLIKTDIETIKLRMLNFLQEAYDDCLEKYFDITDETIRIGKDIARRLKIDYVNLEKDESIDKIKLYIVTNKVLSEKVTTFKTDDFLGKQVELNIWSIRRFYDLYQSGKEREPITIETSKYGLDGIPCIKAEMTGNLDYDAYLAIIPGTFLNKIYYEHGSRLLEGNVRAFLSNRGKVNKGIRETIRLEPTKFFTYNNGIACTASKIALSKDSHKIVMIEDLQIINGGQTTASLTSAVLKDKFAIDNIFVPMKLTVVKNDDYDTMIQNISKYANSQNKVKDSDLFSNHPFHRRFEELANKIQAPAHGDFVNNTFWYYERSRGKYEQEQFKLTKKSEQHDFLKKKPKSQVIKKEELSKYYTCAKLLRPDMVSKGSENCMKFFAEHIDDEFQKKPESFNEEFYKLAICYTILFRSVDRIVNKASWYNVGGYKLNIVPYTISKLIYSLPKGYCLDYDLIWKKQELYPSLNTEIEKIAQITNEFIQKSDGVIVTEYCKKENTWKKFQDYTIKLAPNFIKSLIEEEFMNEKIKSATRESRSKEKVNIEVEIINLGTQYWKNLLEEGKKRKILTPKEIDLLGLVAGIPYFKIPSEKQAKLIWEIRAKLDNSGVLV